MSPERRENRSAPINRRILVDIEDTLDNDLNIHDVPFTYSREYGLDPPNPFVQLQDFGAIGLPLSERDAQAFISFSEKDASQPTNLWEFSDCDVHFMNPKWDQWVKITVAKDVRHILGLPPCECEFGKLSLQSAGSAARPPQDSRQLKASEDRSVFATIEILLPSSFIGGDVTIAYPAVPYEWTTTEENHFSTPVLGFRAGAVRTIAPLQSGYRLSLTYNLVHSGNDSQLQTPFNLIAGKEKLRDILRTWKTDAVSPDVIPIKLAHKYTAGSSFSAASFRHPDDMLLSCLQSLNVDLHLLLLIVHVEHHRTSFISIQGDHSDIEDEEDKPRQTQRYYRSQNELMRFLELYGDENDIDDAEYTSGGMVIKQVVDMEGMPVTVDSLDFPAQSIIHDVYDVGEEEEEESGWERDSMRGRPDFKDFDVDYNDKDRVTGDYLEVWKDTLLVLCRNPSWPVKAGDVFDYACDHLESSQSPMAGANENKLVEALLECCKKPQPRKRPAVDKESKLKRAAALLVNAASRWDDIDLLYKTAEACNIRRKIDRIGSEGFVTAYNTFPWMSVKAFFSDAIIQGESNPYRTDVLRALKQAAEAKADLEVIRWCQETEETVYFNLKPVDETQVSWLVELAKERGVSFFRDRFFERFKSDKNLSVRFWLSLSRKLVQSQHAFDPLAREAFDVLISELTALAVQSLPAFPTKEIVVPPQEKHVYENPADSDSDSARNPFEMEPEYEMDIDLIMDIIGLCVRSNNSKHCGIYFEALHRASRDAEGSGQKHPPWYFYRSLAPKIDVLLTSAPDVDTCDDPWTSFFQAAAQMLVFHSPLTVDSDLELLTMTITRAGGVMTLEAILTPQVLADLAKKDLPSFKGLVVHLYSNLLPAPSAPVSRQNLASIIFSCVQTVIENAPISTVKKVEKLLKFCFRVGIGRQTYPFVLDRILAQGTVNDPEGNTYLKDVLVPMILHLRSILTDYGILLMEQPCKVFCLTVMQLYTSIVVGKKPPHTIPTELTNFGCGCNYCDDAKAFFKNGVQLTHHLCAVAKVRAHVEEKLETQRVRIEAAGVDWYTMRTGSPHSLVITKPKSMSLYPAWEINSQRGVELLNAMGDEKTQKVILGEHYLWIRDILHGDPGTSVPLPTEGFPSKLLTTSGNKRVFDDDIDSEDGSKKKKIKLEE